jgi:hypothetical protein
MNIQDGTATFTIRDERLQALFDMIHPVGSVYTTIKDGKPFDMGEWQEISQGRVLQGVTSGQTAGTTVEAGLPDITGNISLFAHDDWSNGAFYYDKSNWWNSDAWFPFSMSGTRSPAGAFAFKASRSSNIYGNSTTVQPPAYLVHFWVRTA